MTNAEKYNLTKEQVKEIADKLSDYFEEKSCIDEYVIDNIYDVIKRFFILPVKPTLTEDERVILRNIKSNENYKTYIKIGRDNYGSLYLIYDLNKETAKELGELETDFTEFDMYNDLFQFIQNGEEYEIEELLKGE